MKKNFGVIIQGPIISYGSGGKNDNPEGFNSIKTVKENIKIITKFIPKENILFSGWDTDIEIDQLGIAEYRSNDPFRFDFLNQKRQFYTIKEGFNNLSKNKNIEYFIKIRTDQQFLPNFWEWIIENHKELDEKILVSEFYNNSPYVVGDFIICSSKKNFANFINSQSLKRKSINGSRNMVLKYLSYTSNIMMNEFSSNFLINDILLFAKFDNIFEKWSINFRTEFFSIPLIIFKEIIWRGEIMDERFDNINQIFSFNQISNEKHSFKSFWREYGRFFNSIKIYLMRSIKNIL